MIEIIIPILTLSFLGLTFGIGLAIAAKKLCVATDPKVDEVFSRLPGGNCGACGMAGCMGFAEGLIQGTCTIDKCPVTQAVKKIEIAALLGHEIKEKIKTAAVSHCAGGRKVKDRFKYDGIKDCVAADLLQGGQKACTWGCLGFGTCVRVCPVEAIMMNEETGLPEVDEAKCISCGKCVEICPKKLFSLVDVNKPVYIACSSHDFGKEVSEVCPVGCIACRKCEKACSSGAMKVIDNLAVIDYDKYVNCDSCVGVCPTHTILRRK